MTTRHNRRLQPPRRDGRGGEQRRGCGGHGERGGAQSPAVSAGAADLDRVPAVPTAMAAPDTAQSAISPVCVTQKAACGPATVVIYWRRSRRAEAALGVSAEPGSRSAVRGAYHPPADTQRMCPEAVQRLCLMSPLQEEERLDNLHFAEAVFRTGLLAF